MYHKSIAVLLLITLFVFSGITFVGNKAGYDSFWFCIITILASTGFSLFIGAASRSFPILDIADDVKKAADDAKDAVEGAISGLKNALGNDDK